jgi:uncharacterized protein (DUF2252 family)
MFGGTIASVAVRQIKDRPLLDILSVTTMSMQDLNLDRDVRNLIDDFNVDRRPDLRARKYTLMCRDPWSFYRGSCHLFYRDLPPDASWSNIPVGWICGDLHLENFGTFKGIDRQIYFGIDDFDECALAPLSWELARILVSIWLFGDSIELDRPVTRDLCQQWLDKYCNCLRDGEIERVDRDNAKGVVKDLIESLAKRDRVKLLDKRTEIVNNRRQLKIDGEKILGITSLEFDRVSEAVERLSHRDRELELLDRHPNFFQVLDIKFRVAGTGSLGIDRYLVLLTGEGSPDRNYLLDLKYQPQPAIASYLKTPQPNWSDTATRVATVQKLVQPMPPALLNSITIGDRSYLVKELQPTQDKIDLHEPETFDSPERLEKFLKSTAKITASTHLSGANKLGAPSIDLDADWLNESNSWRIDLLEYAEAYASQVEADYHSFKHSIDRIN